MFTKKKNAAFGRYPSCDLINNALRYLRDGDIDNAMAEIIFAIEKANGYFHEDLLETVKEVKNKFWEEHRD